MESPGPPGRSRRRRRFSALYSRFDGGFREAVRGTTLLEKATLLDTIKSGGTVLRGGIAYVRLD